VQDKKWNSIAIDTPPQKQELKLEYKLIFSVFLIFSSLLFQYSWLPQPQPQSPTSTPMGSKQFENTPSTSEIARLMLVFLKLG
jgi:hypothetical protein